ncbi:hypothetical protein ENSA5_42180 [Enhygromyxa salina]|uniref:Uncharacterized protein n=1 Tax=Enhygromyxa salina TaxID=215803 RepID=A0A2S9XLT0_9BACT|nr:hypothetical protein [Enhygromyxa salina]PRP93815.1 hypothetical protein ENSA5_42180 [Enhygromyxa salina]
MSLALVTLLSIAGPLLVGRWLAERDEERDEEPDAETRAVEAHALLILAGGVDP